MCNTYNILKDPYKISKKKASKVRKVWRDSQYTINNQGNANQKKIWDPAILLLIIYPKEMHRFFHWHILQMFTAKLFLIT